MESQFRRRLAAAALRCHANLLIDLAAWAALGAGALCAVLLLGEHLVAVSVLDARVGVGIAGAAAAFVLVAWLLKRPSRMDVALLVDERLGVKERFSTTLALAESRDPFASAARQEAYERAAGVNVARGLPLRMSRRWAWSAGSWALVAVVACLPTWDLLGVEEAARKERLKEREVQQAQADVQRTTDRLEAVVKQLGMAELAEELATIQEIEPGTKPADVRRRAIRKLGDVADRLERMAEAERAEAARNLQDMMKQLKTPDSGLGRELARALARGKFGKAAEMARELAEKLARKDLTDEQRETLAKALESLAEQLDRLAAKQKDLEDALEKAGLSKDLAKLSEEQLRQTLQQQGADAATIEKLLKKAKASKMACKNCAALAQGLAGCRGGGGQPGSGEKLSGEGLQALAQQLDDLESMRQQMALMEAALDELEFGQGALGESLGPGALGMYRPFGDGSPGQGTGSRGQGSGPVDTARGGTVNTLGSRAPNQERPGPIIATWYSHEEQIKGEATRTAGPSVGAAKDRAAEAISDNLIPTKYHGAVKEYFDKLGRPEDE